MRFNEGIEETIRLRGENLFKEGRVNALSCKGQDWYAVVHGSINYDIRLRIENDIVIQHSCNCPYDKSVICKHKIATLYAIENRSNDPDSKKGVRKKIKSLPISIKERNSMLFLRYGRLDVQEGAFVLVDETGIRVHIPIAGISCLFLEPGTTITHAAVSLAAEVGALLLWVGENGVRLYAAGQPGGARSDRLLYQARLALEDSLRIKVVRAMYAFRFGEDPPM